MDFSTLVQPIVERGVSLPSIAKGTACLDYLASDEWFRTPLIIGHEHSICNHACLRGGTTACIFLGVVAKTYIDNIQECRVRLQPSSDLRLLSILGCIPPKRASTID